MPSGSAILAMVGPPGTSDGSRTSTPPSSAAFASEARRSRTSTERTTPGALPRAMWPPGPGSGPPTPGGMVITGPSSIAQLRGGSGSARGAPRHLGGESRFTSEYRSARPAREALTYPLRASGSEPAVRGLDARPTEKRAGRPSQAAPLPCAAFPSQRSVSATVARRYGRQARSYRSRFITLSQAATKSCTNFSFASSQAYTSARARSWAWAPNTRSTRLPVHFFWPVRRS